MALQLPVSQMPALAGTKSPYFKEKYYLLNMFQ